MAKGDATTGDTTAGGTRSVAPDAEREQRLGRLVSRLPGMAFRCAADARWTFELASEGAEALTGYSPAELTDGCMGLLELVHPEDREHVHDEVTGGEGRHFDVRHRMHEATGSVKYVRCVGTVARANGGDVVELEGFLTDVTEDTLAELSLQRQRDLYARVLEGQSDLKQGLVVGSPEGVIYLNSALCRMTGYPHDGLCTNEVFEQVVAPSHRAAAREIVSAIVAGRTPPPVFELSIVTRNGEQRDLALALGEKRHRGAHLYFAIVRDVTEEKWAQGEREAQTLRQTRLAKLGERAIREPNLSRLMDEAAHSAAEVLDLPLVSILELLPGGDLLVRAGVGWNDGTMGSVVPGGKGDSHEGFTLDADGPVVVANAADDSRFKMAAVHVEHDVVSGLAVVIHRGEQPFGVLSVQCPEHRTFSADEVAFLQSVANVLGASIERAWTADAFEKSEADYRSFIEQAPFGVYRSSPDGWFLDVNPALVDMLGYDSAEDLLKANLPRDIYGNSGVRDALLRRVGDSDRFDGVEVSWKRKDGTPMMVRLVGRVVRDAEGNIVRFETIAEDYTERRVLEQQLRQAQKLEALGQLAGGVAHDFNNVLTAITGYSDLVLFRMVEGDPERKRVVEIQKAAERGADLTRQMLAFSRKQVMQPKLLNLKHVVSGLEPMLRRLIDEHVNLLIVPDHDTAKVRADQTQLEQVIMNLAVNARDATPRGGTITIDTANVEVSGEDQAKMLGVPEGRYVRICVADTGKGIEEAHQSRIFEPFFTTKGVGEGTGLGLSTVYGIVNQSGGHLRFDTELGQGTTFRVYLPRVENESSTDSNNITCETVPLGDETILVCEDETAVRDLVIRILENYGYTVLEARHGSDALMLCEQHDEPIHLLVTDVVMPYMSGPELSRRVTALFPDIKVLFMSGYAGRSAVHQESLEPGMAFLPKPFRAEVLAKKVRETLDGVAGA